MRIIATLFALVFMASSAWAGANLQQSDDGRNAQWVNQDGVSFPVGDPGLAVSITDMSTAGTTYVISHKPGLLSKAYTVLHNALSAGSNSPSLTFFLASAASANDGQFTQVSDLSGAALTLGATSAGGNGSLTWDDANSTRVVGQGDVIAIVTDGGSTGTALGTITLVIE